MASWIVHLRIAEKILDHLPNLDAGQFAIGNVAPDSGVPDEQWEHFDPPIEQTHYQNPDHPAPHYLCDDLNFYHQYLDDRVTLETDVKQFSFLLGYFFHLIVDNLWSDRIARPTHERYQNEFDQNSGFIWEVKKDWYGLDFAYVRSHPNSLFWSVFLDSEYQHEYLDYFPPGAISDKLDYIKSFYQRMDEKVEDQLRLSNNIYLNEAEMALFVDGAYRDLLRIYQALWDRRVSTRGLSSAVELLTRY